MTGEQAREDEMSAESATDSPESRLYPFSPTVMTTLFYFGLFAWAAVMLVIALSWGWQDKLFPLVFTGIALVLIAVHLFLMYFGDWVRGILPDTAETGSDELGFDEAEDTAARTGRLRERYELIMIGWVITLPLSLYLIGFLYTIPLYTIGFIWYFNRDLRTAVLTAVVSTALVYGLFVQILGIRLPTGLLFG